MSDTTIDRPGSAADRKTKTSDATKYGALIALVTGMGDWMFLQCYTGGHWHYVPPTQTLIEMAAPLILLPVALWFSNVFSIIGDIITNRLKKAE